MKKIVLLFTALLMGLTTVTATTADIIAADQSTDLDLTSRYRYAQPILFVERGVEFLIFADGSFDFNTDVFSTIPNDNFYYRHPNERTRRNTNRTFGAPGHTFGYNNGGVLIRHDRLGRVRRIGNVFINYDRFGRIKRAGSVYMSYRRGQLRQVGGLRIVYNRFGEMVGTRGQVNFNNPVHTLDQFGTNTYSNQWDNDWDDDFNDEDFYYYRRNGEIKKQRKLNLPEFD